MIDRIIGRLEEIRTGSEGLHSADERVNSLIKDFQRAKELAQKGYQEMDVEES